MSPSEGVKEIEDTPLPVADVDTVFDFLGLGDYPSSCGLRIYLRERQAPVVVLTELRENPGTSVTNAAEFLARQVAQAYDLPSDTVWVEHYEGDTRYSVVELFYIGEGHYHCRGWRYLAPHALRQMIGRGYEQ